MLIQITAQSRFEVSQDPLVVILILQAWGEITVHVSNMNCVCFSGLSQFQHPPRPLSNGGMRVAEDSENENEVDQRQSRERDMMPGTSSVEEHTLEYLPPQLHRGIERLHTVLMELHAISISEIWMTICLAFVFFLCFLDSSHGGLCRKTTSFAVSKRHATSQDAVGHLRALHAAGGVRAFTEYQVTRSCKTYNEQLFLNRNYVPFIHLSSVRLWFILVRVSMNPKPIPGALGVRGEYTLNSTVTKYLSSKLLRFHYRKHFSLDLKSAPK